MRLTALVACLAVCLSSVAGTWSYPAKVVLVEGNVRISSVREAPVILKNYTPLDVGVKVLSSPESLMRGIFYSSFENVMELGPNSKLEVIAASPMSLFLESGTLKIIFESNSDKDISIQTPHTQVVARPGSGFALEVVRDMTIVKVFSEGVRVVSPTQKMNALREAYMMRVFKSRSSDHPIRMRYDEYEKWLDFARSWYSQKDDALARIIGDDYGL